MDTPPVILIDRSEAAARLHVSRRTVERYEQRGLLDSRRIGPKVIRLTEASVEELIRAGKSAAA